MTIENIQGQNNTLGQAWYSIEDEAWYCTHWDGDVCGEGKTLEDAVDDLCVEYASAYINERRREETFGYFVVEPVGLRFIGPVSKYSDIAKVYTFTVSLPRDPNQEEQLVAEAEARPTIYVDEPWEVRAPTEVY